MTSTPLIIVGSGPAGLTAAIYAARAELQPIVFMGQTPGGQLTTTTLVENFPGFPEGVMGPELMQNMIKQAEKFGAKLVYKEVGTLDLARRPFILTDGAGEEYQADALILATGAEPRWLGVPGERELVSKGVHTCATCDGFFYRGKKIAVIGGGDSAMEEALFLTNFASSVTIIHRRAELRASQIMQERAKGNPKIQWLLDTLVVSFEGKDSLTGVKLKRADGTETEEQFDGVFLAIGHVPNTGIFKHVIQTNEEGYVATSTPPLTNVEGVFVAGDVNDWQFRQAITAAGAGCAAALTAERWLREQVDTK